jgi:hypothetical protein
METIDMPTTDRTRERGQLLVVFAIALVAIVGTVGLVIDGGSTFVQRRAEQNVADAAAMAAGYAYLAGTDITVAAHTVAAANGYTDGVDSTTVTVTQSVDDITVTVTRPHQNYFAGVLGFASWDVTTTATVRAGIPNGAYGAMPLLFNEDAFNDPANRSPNTGSFDEPSSGTDDVPQGNAQFNWTIYCTASGNPCNGDSSGVSDIIKGGGNDTTIYLNDDIGPLNAGAHTTLFDELAAFVGQSWPVAIVDDAGSLVGWAWFTITGSVGGSTKQVSGYFSATSVNPAPMVISTTGGIPLSYTGVYIVDLIN